MVECWSDIEFTKHTPHVVLVGELWGVLCMGELWCVWCITNLKPKSNNHQCADNIFKDIFMNEQGQWHSSWVISEEIPQPSITKFSLKSTYRKIAFKLPRGLLPFLPMLYLNSWGENIHSMKTWWLIGAILEIVLCVPELLWNTWVRNMIMVNKFCACFWYVMPFFNLLLLVSGLF